MRKLILLLMFALVGLSAQAQITFVKSYGNVSYVFAYSVQQTSDGGYIVSGGYPDYYNGYSYLIKINANGDTLWTRTYGNANVHNVGYSVQQTNDGGYVIAGTTESSTSGPSHVYLIKTNSTGDTLWTRCYGSTGSDYGYSVKQTNDNGFIIAGATDSLGAGGGDAFLIKTNSIGDTLWTKTYGGDSIDVATFVELTTDGGYIFTGYTKSFGAGGYDVYLIKTDSIGDTLWTKTYGGVNDDQGYSVKQTSDGGYIISGNYTEHFGGNYYYLIKTNSIGDTLWTKTYNDNSGFNPETAYSVQQTLDGGYIIAGSSIFAFEGFAQFDLIKTNSTGDTLWTKEYTNGCSYGYSVQQTTDGGYIIAVGCGNILLIKTDANGNSGCWQLNPGITINSFPTQVSNTATIVKSGCLVSNPSKPVGSGSTVTTDCFSAGINEIKTNDNVSIYPNPTSGIFTLSYNSQLSILNSQFKIYDVTGREVYTQAINNSTQLTIDISQLSKGIYFYQLTNHSETYRGKLVKEN